jgi:hypothetical protein
MWAAGSATLEHVRLKRSPVEAPVARLRLSCLLSSVTLRPPSMPPSALLIVRSMKDPLPGRIATGNEFAMAATPSFEWESAARSELGALYRKAGRPAWGAVPHSAEAVLFADYGELLACLALDLLKGTANSWWWRSILRRFPSRLPGAWAEVWAEHPRYIPAALQQLEERGEVAAVLERVSPVQALRLLLAVLLAYGLPAFLGSQLMVSQTEDSEPAEPAGHSSFSPPEQVSDITATLYSNAPTRRQSYSGSWSGDAVAAARAPWEPYVEASSIPARLGRGRRALLGISLLLRRAPHVASDATFTLHLRRWLAKELEQESRSTGADESFVAVGSPTVLSGPLVHRGIIKVPSATRGREQSLALGIPLTEGSKSIIADSLIEKSETPVQPVFEDGERTCAGGIFYLIHFLRQAELLSLNTGLGGWALLDLLARCLLDRCFHNISGDSVWRALELLDGRKTGVPPGLGFQPQATYEAPESWLRELDSSTHCVRFRSRRVEIWNSEGFLTLDSQSPAALPGRTLHPITRLQRHAWRNVARVCPMDVPLSSELRRFLHFVLPYARWRLHTALGGASVEEVLLRTGTLFVSATHVDMVMGMKQVSLPVRLAGLDANPGWVPELGRVVTFHFVQEGFGGE